MVEGEGFSWRDRLGPDINMCVYTIRLAKSDMNLNPCHLFLAIKKHK